MPYEVMLRFGQWDEILAVPDAYPEHMPFTKCFRHAARAIARAEQATLLNLMKAVPAETTFGNNTAEAIFAVTAPMVEGEILVREGRLDAGLAAFRSAIAAADLLRYDEPPGWILPVRHALGASLMNHGRHAEAERVDRDDLQRLPNNGWSRYGLADALTLQGRHTEAAPLLTRFGAVWSKADGRITSSCFCQP